jgi:hypothetical protein
VTPQQIAEFAALSKVLKALEPLTDAGRRRVWSAIGIVLESSGALGQALEANGKAGRPGTFSDEQVRELRQAYRAKKLTAIGLAQQSGITRATAYRMLSGKSYQHVKGKP